MLTCSLLIFSCAVFWIIPSESTCSHVARLKTRRGSRFIPGLPHFSLTLETFGLGYIRVSKFNRHRNTKEKQVCIDLQHGCVLERVTVPVLQSCLVTNAQKTLNFVFHIEALNFNCSTVWGMHITDSWNNVLSFSGSLVLDERRNYTLPHFDEWMESCHHSHYLLFSSGERLTCAFPSSFLCKCLPVVPIHFAAE